jgi:uncharacterized membrane protein
MNVHPTPQPADMSQVACSQRMEATRGQKFRFSKWFQGHVPTRMSGPTRGEVLPPATDNVVLTCACMVSMAALIPVALYQAGVLRHLPDPPSQIFDSERITSSKAGHPLGIPDSLLGLASFGATFALIVASRRSARGQTLLGLKLTADAGVAAFNAVRQVVSFGQLCSWCTATAGAALIAAAAGHRIIGESWATVASVVTPTVASVAHAAEDTAKTLLPEPLL